jgi:putative lipoic acid-binding regulatory protein
MTAWDTDAEASFLRVLDDYYTWPSVYPFKFIVPSERFEALQALFADDPQTLRESSQGRFVCVTIDKQVRSGQDVVVIYRRAATIEGVISL